MTPRARRRIDRAVSVLAAFCAAAVIAPLLMIFGFLLYQGASAVNVDFFTHLPKPVGEPGGGVANAIVGSLIMIGLAGILAVPLGVLGGVYLAESRERRLPGGVRFLADVLNGVPSIVFGIFAYTIVVIPMRRFSALAGGLALAFIMIPIIVRTAEEMVRLVPNALREAGLGIGLPQWKVTLHVVLPAARAGIVTGVIVAVARVAGETAPLLFTSLNNQYWNWRADQPTASLTVQIFNYAVSPYQDWHDKAWSAALVLLLLVGVLSLAARFLARSRFGAQR